MSLIFPELNKLSMDKLIDAFLEPAPPGEELLFREEVALVIRTRDPALDRLVAYLPRADEDQLRAILIAITGAVSYRKDVNQILRNYLNDRRSMVVSDTVRSLARLGDKEVLGRVHELLHEESAHVRGSVLNYFAKISPSEARPMLIQALKDGSHIVRETAIDELADLYDVSAISEIEALLNDPHPHVREAAASAIAQLTSAE